MTNINGLGPKNGYTRGLAEDGKQAGKQGSAAGSADATATSTGGDSVQLSQGVANMQQLTKSLASEPSFDQAKVDRIKTMIERGDYAIDPAKIAERFRAIEAGSAE